MEPIMPFKILITQPSSDPPNEPPPKSPIQKKTVKKKTKKLTKQNAHGDEDDEFDGIIIGNDDAAALLAEIEGETPAYKSVDYTQPRRPSAPSPCPVDQNLNTEWSQRSRSVEPERKDSSKLSPAMTQSLYSMSDDSEDYFDGLNLDDVDASKLLEEFESEEYDDTYRRAKSATPSPASNASFDTPSTKKPIKNKKNPTENGTSTTTTTSKTTKPAIPHTKTQTPEFATVVQPATSTTNLEKKSATTLPAVTEKKSASTSNLTQEKKVATNGPLQPKPKINDMWEEKVSKMFKEPEPTSALQVALKKKAGISPSPEPKSSTVSNPPEEPVRRKSMLDVLNERKAASKSPSPTASPEPEPKVVEKKTTKTSVKDSELEPKVVEKKLGKIASTSETKSDEAKKSVTKLAKDLPNGEGKKNKDLQNGIVSKKTTTTEDKSPVPDFATTGKKSDNTKPKKKIETSETKKPEPAEATTAKKAMETTEALAKKTISKTDTSSTQFKKTTKSEAKEPTSSTSSAEKKKSVVPENVESKPDDVYQSAKNKLKKVDLLEKESTERSTSVPPLNANKEGSKKEGAKTVKKDTKHEEKTSTIKKAEEKNEKSVPSLPVPEQKRSRTPTPAELKYGRKEPSVREALLDTIAKGSFKLRHVETNDKSSGVLKTPDPDDRAKSVPPPTLAPPPPPQLRPPSPAQLKFAQPEPDARTLLFKAINDGNFKLRKVETNDKSGLIIGDERRATSQPPQPPPPPGLAPSHPNRAPSPAVLKHGGKGELDVRDELFNSIKIGGFKLKKVETKDKSGLILDEEMLAKGCKVAANQVAEPPPPPPPPAVPKASKNSKIPKTPAPPPPPPPTAQPPPPKAPKISKPITNPKLLKLGGKSEANRAELFNAIKTGGFKLKKVEINDKSAPILTEDQETAQLSTSGYVSVAAPPPPPGLPPPPPPLVPRAPGEKVVITNPKLLKLGGKDAKPNVEALFNSIKSGGIKLRKVETNDKSGLILDDEQLKKKDAVEEQPNGQEEKEEKKNLETEGSDDEETSEQSESEENDEEEEIECEEVEEDAEEVTVSRCFKLK